MGNMEPLHRGNNKIRPSGFKYDNGVDDIQHPKYYVVWNMNMISHIYPEFVVSFMAPLDAEGDELFLKQIISHTLFILFWY